MNRYMGAVTAVCTLVAAGVWAAAPGGGGAGVATSQPVAVDEARWAGILQKLANDDFSQREAAQKELEKAGWRELGRLRRLADTATDPEVKSRLSARIVALEEEIAVNPPPLSIELKNASLVDVAAEFSKALGKKVDPWPTNAVAMTNGLYNLSATDKPFWDVFMELSRQNPFVVQESGTQLRVMVQNPGWKYAVVSGPVIVIPTQIFRSRNVALQEANGNPVKPESLTLQATFGFDPRLRLAGYSPARFTEVRDDLGNDLASPGVDRMVDLYSGSARSILINQAIPLKPSEKRGTRIVTAKGEVRFQAVIGEEKLDIENAETKGGQTFDVNVATLILSRLDAKDGQNVNLTIQVIRNPKAAVNLQENGVASLPQINFSLIDSTGKLIHNGIARGSTGVSVGTTYKVPLTLRLSLGTKSKEVAVPFVLKDLPLP